MSFNAPGLKRSGNEIRGCGFFVAQFRIGVDRSSKGLNFAVSGLDFGNQFHDGSDIALVL
jgi:hypothetical protein